MSALICTISKYLILIFMAIFTIRCFLYFTAKTREKRKHHANLQVVDIFAIHFLCHLTMYLNTRELPVIWYYLIEIFIAILYVVLFRIF